MRLIFVADIRTLDPGRKKRRVCEEIETPIVVNKDENKMERLQRMIRPFILRRLKGDVLKDLPEKLEENVYAKMEGEQLALYDAHVQQMKQMLDGKSEAEFKSNKIQILAELTKLRQLCCDPALLFEDYKGESAKVQMCMDLIGNAVHGGHKVLALGHTDGKLSAETVREYVETFYVDGNYTHMVFPGAVYISHPTEYGTLYTKAELAALHEASAAYRIPLFLDGARLGYGLAAAGTDVTLRDIAALTDVFYIGGTKVGALCGEAVVFPHGGMPANFLTIAKQHGALLAKGRLLGVQFDTLFTDGLYEEISRNAIETADRIRAALREKGYRLFCENPTNQIFVVLENKKIKELERQVAMGFTERFDDTHTVMRICTSWATRSEDVDALIALL